MYVLLDRTKYHAVWLIVCAERGTTQGRTIPWSSTAPSPRTRIRRFRGQVCPGSKEAFPQCLHPFVSPILKPLLYGLSNRHSEDFGLQNARRILEKYQSQIPCFNDDVQGTGCVTLAAMMAALQVSQVNLKDVRVVVFGSGTAGTGIADQITDTIATETRKSKAEASKQIWYALPPPFHTYNTLVPY